MQRISTLFTLVALCLTPPSAAMALEKLSDRAILNHFTTQQPRDEAIQHALQWIRKQQNETGALGDKFETAMTSLGLMAHMAAGYLPDGPEHGAWMKTSLRYVLRQQAPDGYFGGADNSRMYGHGMTTLMLAEALGMVQDEALEESIRKALERAVAVTVAAAQVSKDKQHAGGWRYKPDSSHSDMSLSGWQLMSLHAAQRIGIDVPKEVIDNALAYARRCTKETGAVGYQPGKSSPALRGLGLLCFGIANEEEDPLVDKIVRRIQDDPIEWKGQWFFYRVYYDAVGMSRLRPDAWTAYGPILESVLIAHQKEDGSWPTPPGGNEGSHGTLYLTAMSVLALTVERHLLPAYQR